MATEKLVTSNQNGAVRWLTLNQPHRRNPLSTTMIAALSGALSDAYEDSDTRVIVLTAEGPVFSAGHDLAEMERRPDETSQDRESRLAALLEQCAQMMMGIVHAPKPVIACVQGTATAAGCQLVSACDLAIADSSARFCTPGVNIGAFCTTPLVGIGRNLSRKHALEMALTGDFFSAEDAQRFGLINRHVATDQLIPETSRLAERIASRSAESIRDGKSAFYQQVEMPLADAFTHANKVMLNALTSDGDAREGLRAFFEKRPAEWNTL